MKLEKVVLEIDEREIIRKPEELYPLPLPFVKATIDYMHGEKHFYQHYLVKPYKEVGKE